LVEAETVTPLDGTETAVVRRNSSSKKSRGRKSSKGQRGFYSYEHEDFEGQTVTAEDIEYYSHVAYCAIEGLFTPDYLVTDCYLRAAMDCLGWLPLLFVYNYPAVSLACCNGLTSHEKIVEKLLNSSTFEVSGEEEITLRLRNDWKQWLVPNDEGGFGRKELYNSKSR
jgi:hypothetical protein